MKTLLEIFNFSSFSLTQTLGTDSTSNLTIAPTTPNIETDTDKTYKVTANVYSNQIVTYNETVNTTAIFGPIGFD